MYLTDMLRREKNNDMFSRFNTIHDCPQTDGQMEMLYHIQGGQQKVSHKVSEVFVIIAANTIFKIL